MAVFPQRYHTNQLHYLRKTIAFNTPNIATGVSMGKVPTGTMLYTCIMNTKTAFNAAGADRVVVGYNTTFNNIANTTDLAEATVGASEATRCRALVVTAAKEVFVKYTAATGTAATAGAADLILYYAPDNDTLF